MNWNAIFPLVAKDLKLFFRNGFFTFITVLGLAAYIGVYLAMPRSVDETINLGLYSATLPAEISEMMEVEAEPLWRAPSETDLRQAVLDREISAGIALPEALLAQIRAGERPTVTIYLPSDAPEEMHEMMTVMAEAFVLALSGAPLNVEVHEEILGPDMVGQQIPLQDRMLPLFAIFVLMMETLGLASLIGQEIQSRTINALLVTGIGFLMGAAGKDFLSVLGYGIPAIILLSIPAIGIAFPGLLTGWVRIVPSHYLAETLHQVVNFNAGWRQVGMNLIILLAIDIALLSLGVLVLRRKFR